MRVRHRVPSPAVVDIRDATTPAPPPPPPLEGEALAMVQAPRALPTPHGPRDTFVEAEYDLALRGGVIVVRRGPWRIGFPVDGCYWLYCD